MSPGHAEEHPAQVGRMVQVAPPQHHPGTVSHHHHADTQAGREGDHGQEDDAELGVGLEGGNMPMTEQMVPDGSRDSGRNSWWPLCRRPGTARGPAGSQRDP